MSSAAVVIGTLLVKSVVKENMDKNGECIIKINQFNRRNKYIERTELTRVE